MEYIYIYIWHRQDSYTASQLPIYANPYIYAYLSIYANLQLFLFFRCHVMERESFENSATAAILNKSFVSIKVDREERPDVDRIYVGW